MESLNAKAKAGGQPAAKPAAKPMPVPKAKKAPAYKAAAAKKAMPTYAKAVPIPPSHNLEWLTQHSTVDIQELVPEIKGQSASFARAFCVFTKGV